MNPLYLRECLIYSGETGEFRWRDRPREHFTSDKAHKIFTKLYALRECGGISAEGYRVIRVDGRIHKGHRLAWLYTYGQWPAGWLDHVNRNRADNRIENLREATPTLNARNAGRRVDNSSGVRGVTWHKATQKWLAQIAVGGVSHHIGVFESLDLAAAARTVAERELHGEVSA